MKNLCACLSLAAGLALFSIAPAQAADISSYDIVGLRLGMTQKEAEAALLKHNKDIKIVPYKMTYSYSDGVTTFHTDEVLGRVSARYSKLISPSASELEIIVLDFLGTPGKEVLTAINRHQAGMAHPPAVVDFKNSLEKKYGPVTRIDNHVLRWDGDEGTEECFNGLSMNESSPPLNELLAIDQEGKTACRDQLSVAISVTTGDISMESKGPLLSYTAALVGSQLIAGKDAEIQAWVRKLEDDASAKRAAGAEDLKL